MKKPELVAEKYRYMSYIYDPHGKNIEKFGIIYEQYEEEAFKEIYDNVDKFLNFLEDLIEKNKKQPFITPVIKRNISYILENIIWEFDPKDIHRICRINNLIYEIKMLINDDCLEFYRNEYVKRSGYDKRYLKNIDKETLLSTMYISISLDYIFLEWLLYIPLYDIIRIYGDIVFTDMFLSSVNEFISNVPELFLDKQFLNKVESIILYNISELKTIDYKDRKLLNGVNKKILKNIRKIK